MKNKLQDLNNHLFAQIERLGDEDISAADLEKEIGRADAMAKLSHQIISGADLRIKAAKLFADHGDSVLPMLPQVGGESGKG